MAVDEDQKAATQFDIEKLSKIEVEIDFILPDSKKLPITCRVSEKIHEVKAKIYKEANLEEQVLTLEPEAFVLKSDTGQWLADDLADLLSHSYVRHCLAENSRISLHVADRKQVQNRREKLLGKYIGSLVGKPLIYFDQSKDLEVHAFRRNIIKIRKDAIGRRDKLFDFAPVLDTTPILDLDRRKFGEFILFNCHMADNTIWRTTKVMLEETPNEVIERLKGFIAGSLHTSFYSSDDLVLKISGEATYLTGEHHIVDYAYIRHALKEGITKIDVIMVEKEALIEAEDDLYEETVPEPLKSRYNRDPVATSLTQKNFKTVEVMSLWDMNRKFRLRAVGIDNPQTGTASVDGYWLEADLIVGGSQLCGTQTTRFTPIQSERWGQWLVFDLPMKGIPLETRLCLTVWGKRLSKQETKKVKEAKTKKKAAAEEEIALDHGRGKDNIPIGWVNILLINFEGALIQGPQPRRLWMDDKSFWIGTLAESTNGEAPVLHLEFDSYPLVVTFPKVERADLSTMEIPPCTSEKDLADLNRIVAYDPLRTLTDEDKRLVWMYRYFLMANPNALPKFWRSVKMTIKEDVQEAQSLAANWAKMDPVDALELLDSQFSDAVVRAFAVSCIQNLSDKQLLDYLLQLVQVLKYEAYTDSPLARFLIIRALTNKRVGHMFFWFLKAEMGSPAFVDRFGLYMEAFLRGAGRHRMELISQYQILDRLLTTANLLKNQEKENRKEFLQKELARIEFPRRFQLILNPQLEGKGLIVEKCKYFDSKKLPLLLPFQNADKSAEEPIRVMFKSGDDLRQDMLTMQMINVMDATWRKDGLDMCMTPYPVLATGEDQGFLQFVTNSETVSKIQMEFGGARAAFKEEPLDLWLRSKNPKPEDYEKAVKIFTQSCSGYCVATFVLGIGDRHNDNVMLKRDGHLFHIDFGHFLGNIKRKLGIKRERAPFVLTPDFVFVMGKKDSENFAYFIELCVSAYKVIRKSASLFIVLFAMMLSTGIPELRDECDLEYLRWALQVEQSEEEAEQFFRRQVDDAVKKGWSTQLNWWIHNLAHK